VRGVTFVAIQIATAEEVNSVEEDSAFSSSQFEVLIS